MHHGFSDFQQSMHGFKQKKRSEFRALVSY